MKYYKSCLLSLALLVFSLSANAFGQDAADRLKVLEETVEMQRKALEEQHHAIEFLKEEIRKDSEQQDPTISAKATSGFFGGSSLGNPNISLLIDTFVYGSSLENNEQQSRGIPGFTTSGKEFREGFNLGAAEDGAELFIFAPVDPYFNLYAAFPFNDEGVALEEIYAVTTSLPAGVQAKLGKFKSNFSRINAQHPHAWDFFDIALPYRAFLGNEGSGGEKGVQLTLLPSLPFYMQFGVEVLQGENEQMFGAEAESGPHAFTLLAKTSFDTGDYSTLYFGPSVLFGSTRNRNIVSDSVFQAEFDGNSALYSLEALWKWRPSDRRGIILQSEYLYLAQRGDLSFLTPDENLDHVESLRRRQDGFYLQGIYHWQRWRFGARYDRLEILADSFKREGARVDLGGTPWRGTALVEFNPSEFSRIRLQYNHDRTGRDGRTNHEGVLQFILGIGAHAAHPF